MLAIALFGICAGLSAGITNVMVAILIVYFLSLGTPRGVMVPTLNACFLTGKLMQILVLSLAGLVSLRLVLETAPLALAAIGALWIGQRIQPKIQVATYQAVLRKLLLLMALVLIYQFLDEIGYGLQAFAASG